MNQILSALIIKRDTLQAEVIEIENEIFAYLMQNDYQNYLIVNWAEMIKDNNDETIGSR